MNLDHMISVITDRIRTRGSDYKIPYTSAAKDTMELLSRAGHEKAYACQIGRRNPEIVSTSFNYLKRGNSLTSVAYNDGKQNVNYPGGFRGLRLYHVPEGEHLLRRMRWFLHHPVSIFDEHEHPSATKGRLEFHDDVAKHAMKGDYGKILQVIKG